MTVKPGSPKLWRPITLGLLALLAALLLLPLIGSVSIDYGRAFRGLSPDKEILFYVRLPRVLLAMVVGGGLAVAGVLFQALVRDALADPYVLGVAGGAALGAVLAICFGWTEVAGVSGVWVCASIGAGAVLLLVLGIASHGGRMSSFTLLLAGITMNSVCGAMLLFLHNMLDFQKSFAVLRWLMGGIDPTPYSTIGWLAVVVLFAVVFVFLRAREWNLLSVGEEWATARGLSATRLIVTGFVAGSLMTGTVTAMTGPIGFLGLIVPHAVRIRYGADHRILIPGSFLAGAVFLAFCDTVARTVLAPSEIPVGVITAMLGGPFFVWLLRSRKRSLWL